jgi:hypothetical protein
MPFYNQSLIRSTYISLAYGSLSGVFQYGEQIKGGTSGTTAIVVQGLGTTPLVVDQEQGGPFVNGEVITGQQSGASATLSAGPAGAGKDVLTTQAIGPWGLEMLSAVMYCNNSHGAGTLKIQVSNAVIQQANFPNVQPPAASWVDMPANGSLDSSVDMSGGAIVALIAPWPLLSWRWYRFVWTPSDTTDSYNLQLDVCALTRG